MAKIDFSTKDYELPSLNTAFTQDDIQSVLICLHQHRGKYFARPDQGSFLYKPDIELINVSVTVVGRGVDLEEIRQVVRDYFAELGPADAYQEAVLNVRIMNILNVSDVTLNPAINIIPSVTWMRTPWLRLGNLDVRNAV